MDPLVPLPRDQWRQLQEEYRRNWPFGMPGFYMLETQLLHPNLETECNLQVFCPYGDLSSGLIAFNVKAAFNEIIILPTSEFAIDKITAALATTSQIDWTKKVCIPYATSVVLRILAKLCPRVGVKIINPCYTLKHYLSKDTPLYEYDPPPGTYVAPFKHEHISQVDNAWPMKYDTSDEFFKLLVDNGLTYGLFSTEDNSLLAWLTISEVGFLTHLFCEKPHRKKGYAEHIVKFVANDQIKKGKDVFCYILEDNLGSMQLFRKLGFDISGRGVWSFLTPDNIC